MPKRTRRTKNLRTRRGIVLFMVLSTLVVVVILSNVIMNIILNQATLTQHGVSRIRAYYAATAAMNLAMENLRTGTWTTGSYSLSDADISYATAITISDPDAEGKRTITITTTYN